MSASAGFVAQRLLPKRIAGWLSGLRSWQRWKNPPGLSTILVVNLAVTLTDVGLMW